MGLGTSLVCIDSGTILAYNAWSRQQDDNDSHLNSAIRAPHRIREEDVLAGGGVRRVAVELHDNRPARAKDRVEVVSR